MPQGVSDRDIWELVEARKIERMFFDYAYRLDQNNPKELAELFVEDCEVSYAPNFGAKGKAAYEETLSGIGPYFKATTHHVSNIVVDFISDTEARVRSIVLALHRYRKERPDGWLFGQYHDVVIKEDGRWKFKRRELRTDLTIDFHVKTANPIGRGE
jgi:3-phenylpropionate/cinnamic acid dioxygenase small subunit